MPCVEHGSLEAETISFSHEENMQPQNHRRPPLAHSARRLCAFGKRSRVSKLRADPTQESEINPAHPEIPS